MTFTNGPSVNTLDIRGFAFIAFMECLLRYTLSCILIMTLPMAVIARYRG